MIQKLTVATISVLILLTHNACGDGVSQDNDANDSDSFAAEDGGTSLAELPDDFPSELVPPNYDKVEYFDLTHAGAARGVVFESDDDVQAAIEHYTDLLGEPTLSVESEEKMVQWHTTPYKPWMLGVMGNTQETIVSVSALPE